MGFNLKYFKILSPFDKDLAVALVLHLKKKLFTNDLLSREL